MQFINIKPFIRYAQKYTINPGSTYQEVSPCDYRLFFCIDGTGFIRVNNLTYQMKKTSLIIIPPGDRYKLFSSKNTLSYLSINFDYTFTYYNYSHPIPPIPCQKFQPKDIIERITFTDEPSLNNVLYLNNLYHAESKFSRLYFSYSKKFIYYETELSALLLQILTECLRLKKSPVTNQGTEHLEEILKYIRENFNTKLTNREVAKKFGYNPNYLSNLFKLTSGKSLHQYIMSLRLERAFELLENGCKSLTTIAEECGFYDVAHFSKYYKSIIGSSPNKYQHSPNK